MRRRRGLGTVRAVGVAAGLCAAAAPREAAAQNLPYTFDEVVQIASSGVVPDARVAALLRERCVAFRADATALERLRGAGAGEKLVKAVRSACRILPGEPRELRIEPDTVVLRVGDRVTLGARGIGPRGRGLERLRLRWRSKDPQVLSVDGGGRADALAPGMTGVTARATNGVTGSVRVWVLPAPNVRRVRPRTAVLVGVLVPGAAQFYTGQPTKGLVVFGGVAGALALGLGVTEEGGRRPLLWPGLAVGAAFWTYGVLDGYGRARVEAFASGRNERGPRWTFLGAPEPDLHGSARVPLLTFRY